MRPAILTLALLTFGVLPACATTNLVRPLGRGNLRVNASLGGPLVRFGNAPVPIPIAVAGAAYGISDAVDVHADLHATASAFGIAGLDMGLAWHPVPRARSALTLGGTLFGFGNGRDAVLFADLWVGSGWRLLPWLFLGGGLHNGLRIDTSDSALREQLPWTPSAFVQAALRAGRVEFELEFRWNAFVSNGLRVAPAYYPLGELGALGVQLGVSYTFGGT